MISLQQADPLRPKDATNGATMADDDAFLIDGLAGIRSLKYSTLRNQMLGNLTGAPTFKGTVAGNSVPSTSTTAGDYYTITTAGTSQGKTWGIGDVAIYRGTSGQWDKVTSALRPLNVRDFGALLDGSTDDTAAFALTKAACVTGGSVYVPDGTAVIHSLVVDKDISFVLSNAAVLKHKANATGTMIKYTVASSGTFTGGTLDGNGANQTVTGTAQVNSWFACLRTITTTAFTVSDVTFVNFCLAAILDNDSSGRLTISRCNFRNGREHTNGAAVGILGFQSSGINFAPTATVDGRPHLRVTGCNFIQDTLPANAGGNPGGCIIAGRENINCLISVTYQGNYHTRTGQAYAGNFIGSVDLYEDCHGANVMGNVFVDCLYVPMKLQNSGELSCIGNQVIGPSDQVATGIWYDPHERSDGSGVLNENAVFIGNVVKGRGGAGITIAGNVGVGRSIIVSNNDVESCATGFDIGATGATFGLDAPLLIQGNTARGITGTACNITLCSGPIRINGNHFSGANGILATTGVNNAEFYLSHNYLEATSLGSRALIVRGAARVHCYSGVYNNTNGASSNVLNFQWDGTNNIGELLFPGTNIIKIGIPEMVYTQITKIIGSDFALPLTKAARNQIATPATGLRVYQTDNTPGVRVFSNGAWVRYTETADP
jgi:hypothetical protein